jgi:hypothetical protein
LRELLKSRLIWLLHGCVALTRRFAHSFLVYYRPNILVKRLSAVTEKNSTESTDGAISGAQLHALQGGVQHGSESQRVALASVSTYAVECCDHFPSPLHPLYCELRAILTHCAPSSIIICHLFHLFSFLLKSVIYFLFYVSKGYRVRSSRACSSSVQSCSILFKFCSILFRHGAAPQSGFAWCHPHSVITPRRLTVQRRSNDQGEGNTNPQGVALALHWRD